MLYPETPDEVLAFHDKLTECVGAVLPVPVAVSVVVDGWALLTNVSVALAAPVTGGLKVTVNEALWPAGIVTGGERPPRLNTELFVLAAVTVTFAPLAVRLPDAVPLVPTTTLPRPRVVGVTVNCPTSAVPVPDSESVLEPLEASLVSETVALKGPAALGENTRLRVEFWPAVIVIGRLGPLREKYLLETAALLIVTEAAPVFEAVTDMVLVVPAVTLPKSRLRLLRSKLPDCGC